MINRVIKNLSTSLVKIPTISKKNADSISFFLIENIEIASQMSDALDKILKEIKRCSMCNNLCEKDICKVCRDREGSRQLCIVHGLLDLVKIEKDSKYSGKYHIIRGKVDPLQNVHLKDLDIDKMLKRVVKERIEEVILALDPDSEGDLTSHLLISLLRGKVSKITKIAVGIPSGGKIDITDSKTVASAMRNREEV